MQTSDAGSSLQAIKRTSSLRAPIMLLTGHAAEIFTLKFNNSGNLLACELRIFNVLKLCLCIDRRPQCTEESGWTKERTTDSRCAARSRLTRQACVPLEDLRRLRELHGP